MTCRDVGLSSLSLLFCSASMFPLDGPAAVRQEVRYEPVAIISQWGPPVLRAELGRFRVLENRSSGSGRQIELAFVRLRSVADRPGPPIVWLSGGPGDAGTADLGTPALQLFLELRKLGDVIVLDQRGMGSSIPRLDCAGTFRFPGDKPIDRASALEAVEAAGRTCAEKWRSAGVDLSSYNAHESAEDIEDLRIALGAAKLRLLAGSYGTHLALAAIRAHEDSYDRAVLLGIVGPDHLRRSPADSDEQLDRISRLVAAEHTFDKRALDLLALFRRVRNRLEERPATVLLETPGGERRSIVIGEFELQWYTRSLLTTRDAIGHLPALLLAMEAGDFRELARVSDAWRSASLPSASIFTHRCGSAASAERELRIAKERKSAALRDATDFAEESVCRAWGVSPLPRDFREAVRSGLPTLFVSGTLDGDAPESNAIEVLRGFPNGVHLRLEGAAHALLGLDGTAARDAILRFFAGGAIRTARIALPALAFERRVESPPEPLLAAGAIPAKSPF